MIGGVISVLICVWYYRTADRLKLNPLQWIVGGLILFYGARAGWTYGIVKPLMGAGFDRHSMTAGILIELTGALLGAACAALFHNKIMLKQAP
jgi:hypothetical protein